MGHFIRFDVLLLQPGHSPAVCPRCALGAETFGYVLTRYDGGQELRGHCCLDGAQQLLDAMQELAMAEWSKPSAAKARSRSEGRLSLVSSLFTWQCFSRPPAWASASLLV